MMYRLKVRKLPVSLLALGTLLTTCSLANATVTSYNSLASFTSATTGSLTTVTFEDVPDGTSTAYSNPVTLGDLTFTSSGTPYSISADYSPNLYDYSTGDVFASYSGEDFPFLITPDISISALGLDFGSNFVTNFSFEVTDSSGTTTFSNVPGGTPTGGGGAGFNFIGFTSDSPITSLTVIPSGTALISSYDNVVYGSALVVVPEPGTFALALPALTLLGGIAARRRSVK